MFKYLTCFLSFIVDKIGVYKIYKSLCFFFTHFFGIWIVNLIVSAASFLQRHVRRVLSG